MPISALDNATVKLISTTQIITSVSSAAKELIENAFDANASSIDVNLTDSGLTLIEVKDNGSGISKEDASYIGLPSCTSKISNFSDLESLQTYGFRGEAISALCAVSDVTIITKTEQDDAAMSYKFDRYGHIEKSDVCHRANGTTIQVRNLFKGIPVRRQIIADPKKVSQDVKRLETLIKSYGICKFFVQINYKVDNSIIFAKPVMNSMNEAVMYILGRKVTSSMSWFEIENTEINMKLMVPSKELWDIRTILQTSVQYIFVNYRPIKNKDIEKTISKIILEGLKQDSSTRKRPMFILHLLLDPKDIDINLEPNKTGILFKDQQIVLDTIERHLKAFYGIPLETDKDNNSEPTVCSAEYSFDSTKTIADNEWPACKKRKLQIDNKIIDGPVTDVSLLQPKVEQEKIDLCENNTKQKEQPDKEQVTKILNRVQTNANDCTVENHVSKQPEPSIQRGDKPNQDCDRFENDVEHMIHHLPPPDLSDSDSNQSQNLTLQHNENNDFSSVVERNTNDSPVFELSTKNSAESETLTQLPVVDLGEDFVWENIVNGCNKDLNEQKNKVQSVNIQKESHSLQNATLEAWSKGQISGLKGGTDIKPYVTKRNETSTINSVQTDESHSDNSTGFSIFSKHMRSQFEKEYSTLTVPQVAYKITNLWKELTPEERGYYKDLAREEQHERESKKKAKKEKILIDAQKNKKRLLSMLEKMRDLKVEKNEHLVMRTTVPWNISLDKIKKCFFNNSVQKNARLIIGSPSANLWIVNVSSHIWALNTLYLKEQLNASVFDQENKESVEQLLKQWLSEKDDLSLLHPLHSLQSNENM